MSLVEVQEVLKNMSGEELAQAQNAIVLAPNMPPAERATAMSLVSRELRIRQSEGLGCKAARLWNRNSKTIAVVAVGAIIDCCEQQPQLLLLAVFFW